MRRRHGREEAGPAAGAEPSTPLAGGSFDFERDTFAFANETVWSYADGQVQSIHKAEDISGDRYTRRCFLLCRRALQFWKFARFAPQDDPLTDPELARRIRAVARQRTWRAPLPPERRIPVPGYSGLREVSASHPRLFKQTLGPGWTTYFRPGNFVIVFPPSRRHQARVHRDLHAAVTAGHPVVVWLVTFPSLRINHAVLVYAAEDAAPTEHADPAAPAGQADGASGPRHCIRYTVYDPNDVNSPKRLEYDTAARTFSFQPTFYFEGGPVDVRPVYRNILA